MSRESEVNTLGMSITFAKRRADKLGLREISFFLAMAELDFIQSHDDYVGAVIDADLARAEREFTSAVEPKIIGRWDWDVVADRVFADPQVNAVFGLPLSDAGAPIQDYIEQIFQGDRASVEELLQIALAKGGASRLRYRPVRPDDGSLMWVTATGRCLLEAGRAVRFTGTLLAAEPHQLLDLQRMPGA